MLCSSFQLLQNSMTSKPSAQRVRMLAAGHENQDMIPGTHMEEGENQFLKVVLRHLQGFYSMGVSVCMCALAHSNSNSNNDQPQSQPRQPD